ncbi:phage terminase small subunit [Megasphaera massiliensis]|uniref:phage terminase small subunit n=1 Tax=Megasphaera massiliensis TaxID=1232428 RepID=UPI000412FE02|nr:phage terminase small subunit [Megasphaera massiliensis]
MTTQEKAYNDYVKGMKYKDIAKKHGVSLNTVKSWQRRYKWTRKKGAHKKTGAPYYNNNAVGSGESHKGNQNALVHGLYAKYLPDETRELVEALEEKSAIDILWENICIKYAAIIRAQKIMYVDNEKDHSMLVRRKKYGDSTKEIEFEVQFADNRQANFLMAQARAMATLNSMIKQYDEMCRQGLADEEQRLRIEKLKAEVADLQTGNTGDAVSFVFRR